MTSGVVLGVGGGIAAVDQRRVDIALAFLVGLLAAFAASAARLVETRGARKALQATPSWRSVSSRIEARGDFPDRRLVHVGDDAGSACGFWALTQGGWNVPGDESVDALVFGAGASGDMVAVVHPGSASVAVGRIARTR
jgi:hypothetical protein